MNEERYRFYARKDPSEFYAWNAMRQCKEIPTDVKEKRGRGERGEGRGEGVKRIFRTTLGFQSK